jgi:hypothetical protein
MEALCALLSGGPPLPPLSLWPLTQHIARICNGLRWALRCMRHSSLSSRCSSSSTMLPNRRESLVLPARNSTGILSRREQAPTVPMAANGAQRALDLNVGAWPGVGAAPAAKSELRGLLRQRGAPQHSPRKLRVVQRYQSGVWPFSEGKGEKGRTARNFSAPRNPSFYELMGRHPFQAIPNGVVAACSS